MQHCSVQRIVIGRRYDGQAQSQEGRNLVTG